MSAPLLDVAKLDEMAAVFGEEARDALMRRLIDELAVWPTAIAAAVTNGNRDQARAGAHYLRGAALSLGAASVATIADRIEHGADDSDVTALAASATDTRRALAALL